MKSEDNIQIKINNKKIHTKMRKFSQLKKLNKSHI